MESIVVTKIKYAAGDSVFLFRGLYMIGSIKGIYQGNYTSKNNTFIVTKTLRETDACMSIMKVTMEGFSHIRSVGIPKDADIIITDVNVSVVSDLPEETAHYNIVSGVLSDSKQFYFPDTAEYLPLSSDSDSETDIPIELFLSSDRKLEPRFNVTNLCKNKSSIRCFKVDTKVPSSILALELNGVAAYYEFVECFDERQYFIMLGIK